MPQSLSSPVRRLLLIACATTVVTTASGLLLAIFGWRFISPGASVDNPRDLNISSARATGRACAPYQPNALLLSISKNRRTAVAAALVISVIVAACIVILSLYFTHNLFSARPQPAESKPENQDKQDNDPSSHPQHPGCILPSWIAALIVTGVIVLLGIAAIAVVYKYYDRLSATFSVCCRRSPSSGDPDAPHSASKIKYDMKRAELHAKYGAAGQEPVPSPSNTGLTGEEILGRSGQTIRTSLTVSNDTIAIGNDIVRNMLEDRDGLLKANKEMDAIERNMEESEQRLFGMTKRGLRDRVLLVAVIVFLVVCIWIVVDFRWLHLIFK